MVTLGERIQSLKPSPTLAATARARALKAQGKDIVPFTAGEPDLDTPQHVKDAALEALNKGFTKYTPVGGIPSLKEAICGKINREQGIEAKPEQVVVTNGGKQALAAACAVLLNPGDEAVIPSPYWTSYPDMVELAGGAAKIVKTNPESGYLMSAEDLTKACSKRTKMIFLNSPSNPTGACYSGEDLRKLGQAILALPNRDEIVIVSDEVYEYFTYDGFTHVSFLTAAPELRENSLLVNAFSKTYSMTGWRVGYAFGQKKIISAITDHQSQFTSNVCSIAQYAAARAYSDNCAFPKMMQKEFANRLEIVCQAFTEIPGVELNPKPRGAFYAFPTITGLLGKKGKNGALINCGDDFAKYLLEEYDVAVVSGEAFGMPEAFRISFALDEATLRKGLERIHDAVRSLG
jgi:aspartate aminotransferase